LFERNENSLFLDTGVYSFWNYDSHNSVPFDNKVLPAANLYSTHPFYMGYSRQSQDVKRSFWYGIYYNTAAASDYWLDVDTGSSPACTHVHSRAAGGLGDIYILLSDGKEMEGIVKKYHNHIVGNPVLIPQWALGWH
jgi:alpha-glucosidase (family GH31 glycosyl hydrolase)